MYLKCVISSFPYLLFVKLIFFFVIFVFQIVYIYANMVEVMKMFTGMQNADRQSFPLAHMLLLFTKSLL